jgi:kynurenine formamidase
MRFVDLSSCIEVNSGEVIPIEYEKIDCKQGAKLICENAKKFLSIDSDKFVETSFPNHEFISKESIKLETHTGTHVDAPSHFGSPSNGEKPKTIDECPLHWFYGKGILITIKKENTDVITKNEIIKELNHTKIRISPENIVLINTGAYKKWGTEEYFSDFCGMSKEATEYILSFGVKVIGIDSYSFDRPFAKMINDYIATGDRGMLWPSHLLGRTKEYVHIERLANLDALTNIEDFDICCFPIKLKNMDAAWSRVVAILKD